MNEINNTNLILIWITLTYLVIRPYLRRFQIRIEREFKNRKPIGITLTKWERPKGETPNRGMVIFSIYWDKLLGII